jgi:hypothetical protein
VSRSLNPPSRFPNCSPLAEIPDDTGDEDVVVWHNRRVVLIFRAGGQVNDFTEGGASC